MVKTPEDGNYFQGVRDEVRSGDLLRFAYPSSGEGFRVASQVVVSGLIFAFRLQQLYTQTGKREIRDEVLTDQCRHKGNTQASDKK